MSEWKKVRLGDILLIQKKSKIKASDGIENGIYPFFTCSNDIVRTYNSAQYKGPALIFGTGGKASVHFCDTEFSTSTDCLTYYPVSSEINLDLVNKYIQSNIYLLENGFKGAGLKHVSRDYIANIEINLPDIKTQNCIVQKLNKAKNIISNSKKLLTKYDLLIKSRFIEMFGDPVINERKWGKVKLDSVADIKIGPFGSLLHQEDYIIGGHALVNPSHIIDGRICADEKLTISDEKYTELFPYHLQKHDVVMGRRGEMGRCAVVDSDGMLCGTGSLIIRSKGELKPDFIQKIISFPSYKKTIEDKAIGQTMPNLNVPIVSSFEIIKPPKEVQDNYSTFVQQIDKSKFAVQKALEKAETLYKSLMQLYFA